MHLHVFFALRTFSVFVLRLLKRGDVLVVDRPGSSHCYPLSTRSFVAIALPRSRGAAVALNCGPNPTSTPVMTAPLPTVLSAGRVTRGEALGNS